MQVPASMTVCTIARAAARRELFVSSSTKLFIKRGISASASDTLQYRTPPSHYTTVHQIRPFSMVSLFLLATIKLRRVVATEGIGWNTDATWCTVDRFQGHRLGQAWRQLGRVQAPGECHERLDLSRRWRKVPTREGPLPHLRQLRLPMGTSFSPVSLS